MADAEILSRGIGAGWETGRRAWDPTLAVETGSGTEVSSLTAGCRCSRGCGMEKAPGALEIPAERRAQRPSFPARAWTVSSPTSRNFIPFPP